MPQGLPNLVFSTRSRRPTGGADAVREVIAVSPGVPEAARREFAARADLGGSLLHADLAGPVYSLSPVDDRSWLFCRAVSLGLYRKGAHQFLVHGVLLTAGQLAQVDGNPFLLDREEGGLALLSEHPGEGAELPLLAMAPLDAGAAGQANRRRFGELAGRLGADDGWFAAAWETLGRGERVALVDPRPTAELVEWLLLHLHPDDRPLVAFHSWYSHGRPLAYRLLVTAPQESARVRGQFRGVRLVEVAANAGEEDGERTGVGALARRLRRRDPDAYRRLLTDFHLTRLARRPLPPLDEPDVALCLRAELEGEAELTGDEHRRLDLLRLRSEPAAVLRYAVGDLAAAWRRSAADFAALLAPMAASVDVEPEAVAAVAAALAGRPGDGGEGGDERWALLALLDAAGRRRPRRDLEALRGPTWRTLVAPGRLADLVADFDAPRAEAAEEVLTACVLAVAESTVAAARSRGIEDEATGEAGLGVDPDAADWPALFAWQVARGRWPFAAAEAIETLARAAPPALGAAWLRRLGDLRALAGDRAAALRLWLGGEAPRLAGEVRRRRVEAIVGWALEGVGRDGEAAALDDFLDHPELGDAVPAALATWATMQKDADAAWRRLEPLIAGWRLAPQVAPGVGALLARLAASPLASRVPELVATLTRTAGDPGRLVGIALARAADRLTPEVEAARTPEGLRRAVSGAAELLRVRNANPGATAADGALLRLALPALIAAQELTAAGSGGDLVTRFRDAWTGLLASRAARRLDGPAPPEGLDAVAEEDWLDLLLDDLGERPLAAAEDDPRYHFFLVLAWRAWATDPSSRRRLRLRRGLRLPPVAAAPAWHRERVAAVVPAELRTRAHRLLGLPRSGPGDNLRRVVRR